MVVVVMVVVVVVHLVVVVVLATQSREIASGIPENRAIRQPSVSSNGKRCSIAFFVKTVAPGPFPHETSSIF